MDGPRECHTEWSKSDKKKRWNYHMTSLICGIKKEMIQMNLLTKQKETHRLRKRTHGCQGEGIVKDFGKVMYKLLYLKWIANKNLLFSTWNCAQHYVPAWMGGGLGGEWLPCIWMAESLHLFTWNHYNIVNWLHPQYKMFLVLIFFFFKSGTSLVVQWLRIHHMGLIPRQGTKIPHAAMRIPCATAKTECNK